MRKWACRHRWWRRVQSMVPSQREAHIKSVVPRTMVPPHGGEQAAADGVHDDVALCRTTLITAPVQLLINLGVWDSSAVRTLRVGKSVQL